MMDLRPMVRRPCSYAGYFVRVIRTLYLPNLPFSRSPSWTKVNLALPHLNRSVPSSNETFFSRAWYDGHSGHVLLHDLP